MRTGASQVPKDLRVSRATGVFQGIRKHRELGVVEVTRRQRTFLVGGLGVFRYVELASLAREASRQASVHGTGYANDTGNSAWSAADVYNNVIQPKAFILDLTKLTYSVTWNVSNSPAHSLILNNQLVTVSNTVAMPVLNQLAPCS